MRIGFRGTLLFTFAPNNTNVVLNDKGKLKSAFTKCRLLKIKTWAHGSVSRVSCTSGIPYRPLDPDIKRMIVKVEDKQTKDT
jgi:hypothetical protein